MKKALKLANYCGLDPQQTDKFSLIKRVILFGLILFVFLSASLEFFLNLNKAEAFERSAENFVPTLQTISKFSIMIIFKKELKTLIENTKYFWKMNRFGAVLEKEFQQKQKYVDIFFYT